MLPLTILPLESGDKLTRAEFEQRYASMPQVKKAELIEGTVYITPPSTSHTQQSSFPTEAVSPIEGGRQKVKR